MCEVLFLVSQPEDPFVRTNRVGFNMADTNRALLYSLHIHLGDLYRYINLNQNARHYYKQALEIDPARGTVYQKLAFCTPLTKAYRCLYFSIMAANATKAASPMAASNIATVLSRMDTFHFEKFREQLGVKLDMAKVLKVEPPSDGADWFYLVVISIHFNNFNVTCLALLDYLIAAVDDEERKSSGDLDFTLMALEVAIDWITISKLVLLLLLCSKLILCFVNRSQQRRQRRAHGPHQHGTADEGWRTAAAADEHRPQAQLSPTQL